MLTQQRPAQQYRAGRRLRWHDDRRCGHDERHWPGTIVSRETVGAETAVAAGLGRRRSLGSAGRNELGAQLVGLLGRLAVEHT